MHRTIASRYPFLKFIEGEGGEGAPTGAPEGDKKFTQEEVNAFLAKELAPLREQIKTLKPAAEKLATIEESSKTELQKAQSAIEALTAKVGDFEAKAARAVLVDTIAAESKLDDKSKGLLTLSGISDEAALRDFAKGLSDVVSTAPAIPTPLFTPQPGEGVSNKEAAARAAALNGLRNL